MTSASDNSIRNTYDTWYQNNRADLENNRLSLVSEELLLHPELDSQRGLNIISYLSDEVNDWIDSNFLCELDSIMGLNWVLPREDRHVTILDIIPHNSMSKDLIVQQYITWFDQQVTGVAPSLLKIKIQGIFASPDGITLQGYPSITLNDLRSNLRETLSSQSLVNFEANKYKIQTAHIALIKFTEALNGRELLKIVDTMRDTPSSEFKLNNVNLTISSRYDKSKTVEVLSGV